MKFNVYCHKQTTTNKHLTVKFSYAAKGFPQVFDKIPSILKNHFKTFDQTKAPLSIEVIKIS